MAEYLSGNDFSVHYVKQVTKGNVPATPTFNEARRKSGRALKNLSYTQSEEVKTNNQGVENVTDKTTYPAAIEAETTKQSIDFLISAMKSPESVNTVAASDIQFTATNITAAAGTPFDFVSTGDFIFISGSGSNNRAFKVTTKNSDLDLVVSPAPTVEAAGASVTVDMNRTITAKTPVYYALQNRVTDQSLGGDNTSYMTFYDHQINSMSLEIGETGISGNTINFVGENLLAGEAIVSGQTDATKDASNVISNSNDITDFWVNGSTENCVIKSMNIELNNNLQEDDAAGCPTAYADGQMAISAAINARNVITESRRWERLYYADSTQAFAVQIHHGSSDWTIVEFPKARIIEHSIADGANVVASSSMNIGAEEDANNETFIVTRNWV